MHVYYQVKNRVQAPTLARKFDISHWFPCGAGGRADRRTYRHVITKNKEGQKGYRIYLGMGLRLRLELRQKLLGFPSRTRKRGKHQTKPNQATDRKREQNKRLLCVKSLKGIWGIHLSFSYCFESSHRFYEPSGQAPFLNMQYFPFGQGRSYVVAVLFVLIQNFCSMALLL